MNRTLLFCLATLALSADLHAAPRRRAVSRSSFPACTMITGTAAVTFTRDEGRTLTPTAERLSGVGYTYGLTALDANTLLAWHRSNLILSTDAGCSWRVVATASAEFPPTLTATRDGRAYAWSDNRQFLLRYDSRGAVSLKAPGAIIGLGVDPENGERLRAGTADGVVFESIDGGESWSRLTVLETGSNTPGYYRFAFDPVNLDHIVAGTVTTGAFVTFDAGHSWTKAEAFSDRGGNSFNLVISPADPNVVWMMGIDVRESLDSASPSHGRHLYRSTDGGASYSIVVDEGPGVKLINGPTMAAHPRDANILYFVFGTYFQGYGTDLFRYDASTRVLTVTHNDYHDINAIAFSPADATVMYLGLTVEQVF